MQAADHAGRAAVLHALVNGEIVGACREAIKLQLRLIDTLQSQSGMRTHPSPNPPFVW